MKIDILAICTPIALSEYDDRLSPAEVLVWVNPTRQFLRERDDLMTGITSASPEGQPISDDALVPFNNAMMDWYARLWSKGADPATHWTLNEVQELNETDPSLFRWLLKQSNVVMRDHREQKKKASVTPLTRSPAAE